MFKKCVAILMASVMLLLPVTGSAVTWGTVVNQLRSTGSYSGEGVSAKVDGEQVTIEGTETGAEITSPDSLSIDYSTVEGVIAYFFKNIALSADSTSLNNYGEGSLSVTFDKNTQVNTNRFSVNGNGGDIAFTNDGVLHANQAGISSREGGSVTTVNNGEIDSGYLSVNVSTEGSIAFTNNGSIDRLSSYVGDSGSSAVIANNGEAQSLSATAWYGAESSVTNDGHIAGFLDVYAKENAQLSVENNGTVDDSVWLSASADSGITATMNGSFDMLGLQTHDNSTVNVVNNGNPAESYIGFGPTEDHKIGSISVTGNGSLNALEVAVSTPADTVQYFTEAERQQIAASLADNLTLYAGQLGLTGDTTTMEIAFYDSNFDLTEEPTIMTVEIPLVPVAAEENAPAEDKGPSKEQIRHEMEEKRKAESLAGVYASPYLCRQMNLGYRSMNFSIYNAEGEKVLFRERLSWLNGGPLKNLNLRVNTQEAEGLTIRFDGEVLDILDRAEIATLTLLDEDRNAFMQYNVADLRAARETYGLAREELLIVGGMDDEVMKVAVDGSIVPVE